MILNFVRVVIVALLILGCCWQGGSDNDLIEVSVAGHVLRSGVYMLKEGSTLGDVLEKSGFFYYDKDDPWSGPMLEKIRIRRMVDSEWRDIFVNYKRILNHDGPDIILQDKDEIFVSRYL
jgi:protein involved in polysaccharide export with SLBB domain